MPTKTARVPLSMKEATAALDAGKLQWRYGKNEWKTIHRDKNQFRYPRNSERISVIIEPTKVMRECGAIGGMANGLDSGELKRHASRYRIIS